MLWVHLLLAVMWLATAILYAIAAVKFWRRSKGK